VRKMAKVKLSEVEISEEDYKSLKNFLFEWNICKDEKCVKRVLLEWMTEEDEEDDDDYYDYQEEDDEEYDPDLYYCDYICDSELDINESSDYDEEIDDDP
jgi:hypothetical protein